MDQISSITFGRMDKLVDEIVRDEKLSDYEKYLRIMVKVVGPLVDANEALRKKTKEQDDQLTEWGWEREAAHENDWRQVHEMGC